MEFLIKLTAVIIGHLKSYTYFNTPISVFNDLSVALRCLAITIKYFVRKVG